MRSPVESIRKENINPRVLSSRKIFTGSYMTFSDPEDAIYEPLFIAPHLSLSIFPILLVSAPSGNEARKQT
jgi:hypothetical protein